MWIWLKCLKCDLKNGERISKRYSNVVDVRVSVWVPVFDSEICDWLIGSKWLRSPSTRSDLRPSTKSDVRKACGGPWIICKHDIRISLSLVFTMSWLSILPLAKFQPGGEGQHFPASARAVVQVGWSCCPPTRSRTSVVESLNMWRRGLGQTLGCLCCWWWIYNIIEPTSS